MLLAVKRSKHDLVKFTLSILRCKVATIAGSVPWDDANLKKRKRSIRVLHINLFLRRVDRHSKRRVVHLSERTHYSCCHAVGDTSIVRRRNVPGNHLKPLQRHRVWTKKRTVP